MGHRHGRQTLKPLGIDEQAFALMAEGATDRTPVAGWTHNFYRYPARFSPQFAAAAINTFSRQGDLILDPYMGGGTAVVEGVIAGRRVVGNDLNSLAAFITKVKITPLDSSETRALKRWVTNCIPSFTYHRPADELAEYIDPQKTKNLSLARARFIKKAVAAALASIDRLTSPNAQDFAKCVVLRVGQWALDGRERHTPLSDFRSNLVTTANEMLQSIASLGKQTTKTGGKATIIHGDAALLGEAWPFRARGDRASLVVTSPPYPGVHVLYHRWQVDGRRESPAPYWIAGCNDGQGAAFYSFGSRHAESGERYFRESLATLKAIRSVMRDGGYMVQMLAFNNPSSQLPQYLRNMEEAGFIEVTSSTAGRIWRQVPGRKWHARQMGKTNSSKEVVLVHQAI